METVIIVMIILVILRKPISSMLNSFNSSLEIEIKENEIKNLKRINRLYDKNKDQLNSLKSVKEIDELLNDLLEK